MVDLALDESTGDLVVADGELQLVGRGDTDDGDVICQRMRVRLRTWVNEWFLDRRVYMRYLQRILKKGVRPADVVAEYRDVIETTPGVLQLLALDLQLDPRTRIMSGTGSVLTTEGARSFNLVTPGGATPLPGAR